MLFNQAYLYSRLFTSLLPSPSKTINNDLMRKKRLEAASGDTDSPDLL
jgi:hypothetical protein